MRIDKLELKAFGPFTERVLDFSQRPRALQLVYGPNEAGKSSTLRALISLLYGIDARTQDAHLHDMSKLRIGATLVDEVGTRLSIVRRKGNKNTLLNAAEEPLGEGALTPLLGGLDQALFTQMFGLDHERLREGAEALLRGGGQLGEVLFDASTGGRGVHTLLESLRAEAESLYKARGRTPELNVALEGLREKKKLAKEAELDPKAYAQQQTALAEARLERDQLSEQRRALGVEKSRLTQLLSVLPLVAKRDAVLAELGAQSAALRADAAGAAAGAPSEALLEQTVQELNRRYGSVLANQRDEPARLAELASLGREIAELRARLGHGLADLHGLDSAVRARLRKLVEEERKLASERAELVRAEAGAQAEAERLQASLELLPANELGGLSVLLLELEREDLAGLLARNEAELEKLSAQLSRRSKQTGLQLDLTQLSEGALPSDGLVSELERASDQRERERERIHKERTLALEQQTRLSTQRSELLLRGELATREELAQARTERDAAFDALFAEGAGPAAALVRAYTMAMQRADALADRLVREAQESAELSRIDLSLAQLEQQQAAREQVLTQLAASEREQAERWRQLAEPYGLAAHAPRAARPLLAELGLLKEQLHERALLEVQRASLESRASVRCAELSAQLGELVELRALGTPRQQLEQQSRRARELRTLALERARERDSLRAQLEKLASERATRSGRVGVIEREQSAAHERYLGELTRLGLSALLAPEELLACFDELTELAQRLRASATLNDRIEAARIEEHALAHDVAALVARSLPAVEGEPLPIDQALTAVSRLARARSEAERDLTRHRAELEKLDEQLVTLGDGLALAELRARLGTFEPHVARARLEEIDTSLEDSAEKSGDLEQKIGRLSGGLELLERASGAGELAEDYELELARAQALSRRYVEVRLALALLGSQVERYRSTHQQPVLKRASELFPRLTLQRYRGLTVEFDEQDEPVLSCQVASGHTVRIPALSDGTRDQLYLALRVASIERYFEGRPPLPLILDDALIHFDDARASAALEVLGELGKHTQVLFFTHHKRMLELARGALGEHGVQVHELAGRAVPRSDGPLFEA